MNGISPEFGQHSDLIPGILTPPGMHRQQRQKRVGSHVKPLPLASNADPGLIEMRHLRVNELLLSLVFPALEITARSVLKLANRTRTQAESVKVPKNLASARHRNQLINTKIQGQGLDLRSVTQVRASVFGKLGSVSPQAFSTALPLGVMLRDVSSPLMEVDHLADLKIDYRLLL